MRLAVLCSHPIQYYAPLFREIARLHDVIVYYAHDATSQDQARAGFGHPFTWDVPLTSGYAHVFLQNRSSAPGPHHFAGCDTPEIAGLLKEGDFDALLVMGWHLKSYLQGIIAARRLGIPLMVRGDSQLDTPRSLTKHIVKELAFPALLRTFSAALFVGERSRAYYRHYKFPQERLFYSPHCVDTAWFAARATPSARARIRSRFGVADDTSLLLFAGKLVHFKRPSDLIDAAALLRREGRSVEVLIAGAGELRNALLARASDAEVPVHELGFCNQSEMPAAYAASDTLVLPSDARESWGLVVNEALASGTPVVVSEACGCAPDLACGSAGRSFSLGNLRELARAVAQVCDERPTRAAIKEASDRHSLPAAAAGISNALREIAQPRRGGSIAAT